MTCVRLLALTLLFAVVAACEYVKVPLTDINARFALAEAAWFEEEETLFFFWRVDADQGLGPLSQVEVRYRTDDLDQDWVPLHTLQSVHSHVEADCGPHTKCGSFSLHVVKPPRDVRMRLRYHRDGAMVLDAGLNVNTVLTGPPQTNRSAIVYGVFDEQNLRVQWRLRHQFPTVRNEDAQALGLRRYFAVYEPKYGDVPLPIQDNPYAYGANGSCPGNFTALGWTPMSTIDRAVWAPETVPVPAYPSAVICARSVVRDARGEFQTEALARKNPQVAPAFPSLRSPIREDVTVPFFLRICDRTISQEHEEMQVQRLLLEDQPVICIDGWSAPGFADQLASQFRSRIDAIRAGGKDMVLTFSLHHDDTTGKLAQVIEDALMRVLPFENSKSSPRVSGAFVFDSQGYTLKTAELRRLVLWCPANLPSDNLDEIPSTSVRSCPLLPDQPDLKLGPFTFGQLPILATRKQYLKFIDTYSEAQAGKTKTLTFSAPTRTPLSTNIPVGDFGVATFFNNEVLTAAPTDAFSVCAPEDGSLSPVVFKVTVPSADGGVEDTVIPISTLPEVHSLFPFPSYPLGLAWDSPYLLRLEYEVVVAGAASAYSLSVPFGIASTNQSYYGNELWKKGEFDLHELLIRCTRFCDQPTFDSAGVYNVNALFAQTYRANCYRPLYPVADEGGGFPIDP